MQYYSSSQQQSFQNWKLVLNCKRHMPKAHKLLYDSNPSNPLIFFS